MTPATRSIDAGLLLYHVDEPQIHELGATSEALARLSLLAKATPAVKLTPQAEFFSIGCNELPTLAEKLCSWAK